MSSEALILVLHARPRSPLAKLILLRLADCFDGVGYLDPDKISEFCCCQPADVVAEINGLIEDGFLVREDATRVRIAGHVPHWEQPTERPSYVKKPVSWSRRFKVFERDGFKCKACGTPENLTIDHIEPERHGGTSVIENLQTLCKSCNSKKGTRRG